MYKACLSEMLGNDFVQVSTVKMSKITKCLIQLAVEFIILPFCNPGFFFSNIELFFYIKKELDLKKNSTMQSLALGRVEGLLKSKCCSKN